MIDLRTLKSADPAEPRRQPVEDRRFTARGMFKKLSPLAAVGALLASTITACGSSDTGTGDADNADDDATLTTVDGDASSEANAAGGSGTAGDDATLTTVDGDASSEANAAGGSDGEGMPDDAVSTTPDDLAGDNLGMPAEDQPPPRDSLVPAAVSDAAYRVMMIDPPQVVIEVSGELTDPCQEAWSEWHSNEDSTVYNVEIWGVLPTSEDDSLRCAQVLTPFTVDVFLEGPAEFGGFPPGEYTVVVNDTVTLDISI